MVLPAGKHHGERGGKPQKFKHMSPSNLFPRDVQGYAGSVFSCKKGDAGPSLEDSMALVVFTHSFGAESAAKATTGKPREILSANSGQRKRFSCY